MAELIPALRRQALTSLVMILGIGAMTVVLTAMFVNSTLNSDDRWAFAIWPVLIGFIAVVAVYK